MLQNADRFRWNNASFWGANFVWTTLHDFGGTDGLKGDLSRINEIPFGALEPEFHRDSGVWGTGFTPEGIDQNPVLVHDDVRIALEC